MPATVKTKVDLKALLALPKRERLKIAKALRASVEEEAEEAEYESALLAELERRAAASKADPSRLKTMAPGEMVQWVKARKK